MMELNRDTRREMARVAREAQHLWQDQRGVFLSAKKVARNAGRRAGVAAKRDVWPRAHEAYRESIGPVLAKLPRPFSAKAPVKGPANPFVYILMAVGALAVALVGYAAWQTLRADDDLWVEEDD